MEPQFFGDNVTHKSQKKQRYIPLVIGEILKNLPG